MAIGDTGAQDAIPPTSEIAPFEANNALSRQLNPSSDAQQRATTGSPLAPNRDQFASLHVQRHIPQRDTLHPSAPVTVGDVLYRQKAHRGPSPPGTSRPANARSSARA